MLFFFFNKSTFQKLHGITMDHVQVQGGRTNVIDLKLILRTYLGN